LKEKHESSVEQRLDELEQLMMQIYKEQQGREDQEEIAK